jgi:hypothetical protein
MNMMDLSGLLKRTVLGVNMTPRERLAWLEHTNKVPLSPHTEYDTWTRDQLVDEIIELRLRVARLEKANSDMGWMLYPDTMGR